MRVALVVLVLLTVAGCSSQQGFDFSQVKSSVDSTNKAAKVGVGQPI
jgi:hypothetical protein